MKAEGANSPADIFLTVDAGRIWLADQDGLLQPVAFRRCSSERIPEHLRHPDGHWFGLSQRARVIFYAKDRVANPPQTYEALADPAYKGTDLHPLVVERLQPVADVGDDRQRRRGGGQGLGRGAARQPRPRARGRRQRPDQGAWSPASATSRWPTPTISSAALGNEPSRGHQSRASTTSAVVFPEPGDDAAPTSTSPPPASPRTRRTRTPRSASSNTSRRPRRRPTSPTRTTSIPAADRRRRSAEVPASYGTFRSDTLNLSALGENQPKAQEIFNEIGFP